VNHKKQNKNMKLKNLALLACSLTFAAASSFAQGLHLGVKAGANIFKVDGASMKDEFTFGYNLGAFAELNFNEKFGIQPEVLWNQTNYRTGNNFSDVYGIEGRNDVKGKLNYLSIPVLLNYNVAKFFTIQAGPQFGILLNQDKNLFDNGKEAFKKGDFSLLGGVQLNLGGLKIGGRYVIGLADINDVDDREKWKNQGFQVYVGTRIF
jgi:hypothetical protein